MEKPENHLPLKNSLQISERTHRGKARKKKAATPHRGGKTGWTRRRGGSSVRKGEWTGSVVLKKQGAKSY